MKTAVTDFANGSVQIFTFNSKLDFSLKEIGIAPPQSYRITTVFFRRKCKQRIKISKFVSTTFIWTPGHTDIPGNSSRANELHRKVR